MAVYSENLSNIALSQSGDMEATEELIRTNYALAASLARRFQGRGVETEDLIQIALMGMLKAIRTFDMERGTAFSTYAVPLIIGEIRKFLRDDGLIKVSRENKRNCAILLRTREKYIEESGEEPTVSRLCQLTSLSKEEVQAALDSSRPVASLSDPLGDEADFTVENTLEDRSSSIEGSIEKIALWDALKKLGERERQIIILRYFRDMSQQQVADTLGLSQVKVSREEKKIIMQLRKEII